MTRGWRLVEAADLRSRNTMGVPARAPVLVEVLDDAALPDALASPALRDGISLVLGGGSNVLFAGDPVGAVLALRGEGISLAGSSGGRTIVRAAAGLDWDACVRWTLAKGLAGLENLSLIPGTVGAAPIQNIGAYGAEVGELIHAVHAFDTATGRMVHLAATECGFAYRDSRFKREPRRWIVTAVEFALAADAPLRLDYAGIDEELLAAGVDVPRAADVAAAVVRLRRRKLPDPAVIGNAGSFFKNPIVSSHIAAALQAAHPRMPVFPATAFPADAALHEHAHAGIDAVARKLSAAWLIDACGWKGHRDGDAGVSAGHALVLVNHGAASGAQLLSLARRIADSVHSRFGVTLEPEPRIVGADW